VVQRLSGFDKHLQAIHAREANAQRITPPLIPGILNVRDLTVCRPDGEILLDKISFDLSQGERMLIMGPTGAGKSTLLRAIAGLWPFCSGIIRTAEESTLFVPQRPYIPLGSLAEALLYPNLSEQNDSKDRLAFVLMNVGLADLVTELDHADQWFQRLSLGEQQRLAFARIFLSEPDIILLDEVTSALDEESELKLYQLLCEASWRPTIISVGHRTTLRKYHDRLLNVTAFQAGIDLQTSKTGMAKMLGVVHGGLSQMAEPSN
ncbi:MAG: ATP-binding cassette domain-containing protein, partial [Verrucomicrobia bacterium]|nr:ATP-binding cassette domain-containing protein [Verrucomicrobiota bacterium]